MSACDGVMEAPLLPLHAGCVQSETDCKWKDENMRSGALFLATDARSADKTCPKTSDSRHATCYAQLVRSTAERRIRLAERARVERIERGLHRRLLDADSEGGQLRSYAARAQLADDVQR